MTAIRKYWIALIFSGLSLAAFAQHDHEHHPQQTGDQHEQPNQTDHAQTAAAAGGAHGDCGHPIDEVKEGEFNAGETAIHHIADANAVHIFGNLYLHLPCILYAPGHGWTLTTTSAFHPHHHGNGEVSKKGYVLVHGNVMRIKDPAFAAGEYNIEGYTHKEIEKDGKTKTIYSALINGECKELDPKSTLDGGIMGGGITSFYDYSITRNVFTMILTALLLFFLFRVAATTAMRREGQAPKGLQNFLEPFYTFIRDDVARPAIGPKYEKYMPFLLSVFFFILGLNLIGQIPFFPGSANVTGNISVTIVLALITFVIMLLSSNKHFWEHTLWMPGIPPVLKILILTPVEILGLFLRPFTLLLRLFANITAGHIVILCFVGLIFIFGKAGTSVGGSITGVLAAIPLSLFMMALELLVAFLQAFIFTMLSATYFGMALEEPHHDHH
ncbi:MAG: ATP synthase subunit a [Saprospiraceae bacterium]|nr:ATP synthase subunit a [Saprospiraceae bacterium]